MAALPTDLQVVADTLLAHARERMADGDEFLLTAYLYRRADRALIEFEAEQAANKPEAAAVLRQLAQAEQPDAIFILSEGWALPPELKADSARILARYGSLSNCPHAIEILMLGVQSYDGNWLGKGRIITRGRARRAEPFNLAPDEQAPVGLFDNLLPVRANPPRKDAP